MTNKTDADIVLDNLGIFVRVATKYWHRFPPALRATYGVDDLVSEITVQVFRQRHRYDPKRGARSTFVWCLAENHCRSLQQAFQQQKRQGVILSMDSVVLGTQCLVHRRGEALGALESVLQDASLELRELLQAFLYLQHRPRWPQTARTELKRLLCKHQVSLEQFSLALAWCPLPAVGL